jgi:DNA polymerase-4
MRRAIFLVDMNAFFISCETTRRPELRGRPAAVAGDPKRRSGIILAANYDARAYGVRTTMTLHEAQKLCPGIILVPPDHSFYAKKSREVMELLYRYSPALEQNSIDEAWLDMSGSELLFGEPRKSAEKIMDEIKNNLGLWCSIGIAENKFLAKMASEMKKPLGITELWEEDIKTKLWSLPIEAMYGIGAQTALKLRGVGMSTIGDMARYGGGMLEKRFGKYGAMLYELAKGIDPSPVTPRVANSMKSIGRSITLPQDIADLKYASKILMSLAEEVGADARRHVKKGTTVSITLKYADFTSVTRQTTVPQTYLTKDIYAAGAALLQKNWTRRPVRLIGISISGFRADGESEQLSFFATDNTENKKEEHLEKAVDGIRQRFGDDTIKRAALIEKPKDNTQSE